MEELVKLLEDVMNAGLIDMVISGPKNTSEYVKVKVRPIKIKEEICFQIAKYTDKQVFHENLEADEAVKALSEMIMACFKQVQIKASGRQASVLVSKKGKVTIKSKLVGKLEAKPVPEHNRGKKYIIPEGVPVPFMVDLGVMTPEGMIVKARYDKYRQINRFLEFIRDILPELPTGRELTMIDFGCGKSYLTFAMYYYLRTVSGLDVRIIGLDLKKQVIEDCQRLADKYGYDKLKFLCGDIADYEGVDQVDMVVTLHACDTATDFALAKAVRWGACVILSVPCCQHELHRQMACDTLSGAMKYGLIQERTAALMTDAMRGQLLELEGYKVQLLEFIDMEHTPKNILIRAVKQHKMMPAGAKRAQREAYVRCRDFFGAKPILEKLLSEADQEGIDE